MSSQKRELQRIKREKAIRKQKMKKTLKISLACLAGLLFLAGIVYWIVYETVIVTKSVDDYSKGIAADGKIEGVVATEYVTLPDYSKIEAKYEDVRMTEEEVDAKIEAELLNKAVYSTESDKVLEMGDKINLDYVGYIDGIAFENGSTEGNGTDITLGQAGYIDDFEEQIAGHKVGESFDINVTFPEDYGKEELNGKEAVFSITINGVYEIPELTDAFVKENYSDIASTVAEYRQHLIDEEVVNEMLNYGYTYVYNNTTINEYPDSYVKVVMGREKYSDEQTLEYYAQMGLQMTWKDFIGMSDSEYEAELRLNAEDKVKSQLMIQAIFEAENMTITDEAYNAVIAELGGSDELSNQIVEEYGEGYIRQEAMKDLVEEFLNSKAVLIKE
ncbi:MAG: hypothetical protein E7288_04570 [Lachnospiraceae bacterium]|nr:hypothetical protein [Lachnospiraceae bacterium]